LAAWHHAVVGERLRYAPLAGFSKRHEFSDADATCALAAVDQWCLHATEGHQSSTRNHLDPDTEIPWQALKAVQGESTYGGRVDSVFDQAALTRILDQTFSPEAFRPDLRTPAERSCGKWGSCRTAGSTTTLTTTTTTTTLLRALLLARVGRTKKEKQRPRLRKRPGSLLP